MKYYYFLSIVLLLSCKTNTKTVLSGIIENPKSEFVHLTLGDSILTEKLDKTNSFNFEINITKSGYYRFDHEEHTELFLSPGKNLRLSLDTKRFDESLLFTGDLAAENNYLSWQSLEFEKIQNQKNRLYNLEKDKFGYFIDSVTTNISNRLASISAPDSTFLHTENKKIETFKRSYLNYYDKMHLLQVGDIAPDFKCKDINGTNYNLNNFKGEVLVIDVWATWCTGCLNEFPYLDRLKEKYASSDIQFISISIDDKRDVWLNTIQKKDLKGIQLWAQDGKNSQFSLDYYLEECGLPCFILIDGTGKIINARAPRPSENLDYILTKLDKIK
jgi:peroxiredoxin